MYADDLWCLVASAGGQQDLLSMCIVIMPNYMILFLIVKRLLV